MPCTEYKIVTEKDWSGVYFRVGDCDWIFLTEFFGPFSVEEAEQYLKCVKNAE